MMNQDKAPFTEPKSQVDFKALWTSRTKAPSPLTLKWGDLYRTHPAEYLKAVTEENRQRNLAGGQVHKQVVEAQAALTNQETVGTVTNVRKRMKERMDHRTLAKEPSRSPNMTQLENVDALKSCEKVPKLRKAKKGRGRAKAGTPEAKRQTAAACAKNRSRRKAALNCQSSNGPEL
jgi:hypothetical protein